MSNVFEWMLATDGEEMAGLSFSTRIPTFVSQVTIQPIGQITDGSIAMLVLPPGPITF